MRYVQLTAETETVIGPDNVKVKYCDQVWTEVWSDEQDFAEYAKDKHYKMLMYKNADRCTIDTGEIFYERDGKWQDFFHDMTFGGDFHMPKLAFIIHDLDLSRYNDLRDAEMFSFDDYGICSIFCEYRAHSDDENPVFFNCVGEGGVKFGRAATVDDVYRHIRLHHDMMSTKCLLHMDILDGRGEALADFVKKFMSDYPKCIEFAKWQDEKTDPVPLLQEILADAKKRVEFEDPGVQYYQEIIDLTDGKLG